MQRLTLTITAAMASFMQQQAKRNQSIVVVSNPAEDSKPTKELHYEISSIRRRL